MPFVKELSEYELDLMGVQESDGTEVVLNKQAIMHFSSEKEMRIMN
jgi:hypothetical protein